MWVSKHVSKLDFACHPAVDIFPQPGTFLSALSERKGVALLDLAHPVEIKAAVTLWFAQINRPFLFMFPRTGPVNSDLSQRN